MNTGLVLRRCLPQIKQVSLIITFRVKTRFTIMGALNNVLMQSRQIKTWFA